MKTNFKRILSILICMLIFISSVFSVSAYSTGDDYPYRNASASEKGKWVLSSYNFYKWQCTDFVAWCLNTRNGINFNNNYRNKKWGDAQNWDNVAGSLKIPVNKTPAVGAVAYWNSNSKDARETGHVAWVKEVRSNGNVVFEMYNWKCKESNYTGKCFVSVVRKSDYCDGYIHFADITTSTPYTYSTLTQGNYRIKNASTGEYLCVAQSSDKDAANVGAWPLTSESGMIWNITSTSNGYKMLPKCSSSRVLNIEGTVATNGTNTTIRTYSNNSTQWWKFEKVSGGYRIHTACNEYCVLSKGSGNNVNVQSASESKSQVWILEPYDISPISKAEINVASSKTLDYGTNVTIKATAKNVPSNYYLVLKTGDNEIKGTNTEVSFNFGELKSDINYSVKVINNKNEILKDSNGNNLIKESSIKVNNNIFKRISAFFMRLFNILPKVTVSP